MPVVLSLSIFGLLGIFCRWGLDRYFAFLNIQSFLSTLTVNILGSALVGLFYALGERGQVSESLLVGLIIGFCGGFTTFSSYALQAVILFEKAQFQTALLYFLVSPILSLGAVFLALQLSRRFLFA